MKTIYLTMSKALIATLALGLVVGTTSCKEEGCTDPNATNYNADADEDDGSCEYVENPTGPGETVDFGELSGTNGLADLTGYDAATSTLTLDGDNVYTFSGLLYVNSGQTLAIEAGTVVKAGGEVNGLASAIVVARGGTIEADGTSADPIIFTSDLDDLSNSTDLGPSDAGLWGSLIILGDAEIGVEGASEAFIEGLPENDDRNKFGGSNSGHDAGFLRYVSIRYTGAALGPGNEIQGLTLGGVGSETEISYVEVYASDDDGIEIFGGNVNMDHIAIAWAADDGLDLDNGWRGTVDKLFIVQLGSEGDHLGEWDGAQPDDNDRYTLATVKNATMMGAGDGSLAILTRDGGVVSIQTSVITDVNGKALEVEDNDEAGVDSYSKLSEASYNGNAWFCGGYTAISSDMTDGVIQVTEGGAQPDAADLVAKLTSGINSFDVDPAMTWSDEQNGTLDPFTPAMSGVGAFSADGNWLQGWSGLSTLGHLAE